MTAIALPTRGPAQDSRPHVPPPLGGANGPVALPSRLAELTGTGFPAHPGQTPNTDGPGGPAPEISFYRPPMDDDWRRANLLPTPRGYALTRYTREYRANIAGALGFIPPRTGGPAFTTDTVDAAPGPAAPIPYDRRRINQTLREQFDTRDHADYLPVEQIQLSLGPRQMLAGGNGPQMEPAYFPRLTRWWNPRSYGQTTQVIAPTPASLSRFSR